MTDTNALLHVLEGLRLRRLTATYKAVADAIGLTPPGQIQALAALLEAIQEDDARLGRPQKASLVIQNGKEPIPRPGFFQKLSTLGVYRGVDRGAEAAMWHQNEIECLYELTPER
ncbi:hypothetical protein [Saccharospirillum impatiens]|uniref:hypothetical protein n=1 Tax=Saccharospirillum impatiens TaxID=169438 RepID=UPI000420D664|nr:hypothetical protein [Saccharospirillum impatiens]